MTADAPRNRWRPGHSRRWFLLPVAAAVAVLVAVVVLAPGPPRVDTEPPAPLVRVMVVAPESVVPTLEGYGEIRAERSWQAVAQVPGRVHWRHPRLHPGARFDAGERLIEIDPLDYRIAMERAEAQLGGATTALAELDAAARDMAVSRDIERESLDLAEHEFERRQRLAAGGHIAAVELDAERQRLLRQRQALQSMEAELNLVPSRREGLQARQREARLQLDRARQDLQRTVLALPFDGRIAEVNVELGQFVPAGQAMFSATGTERLEALLEVPVDQLVSRFPEALSASAVDALSARLSWRAGDAAFEWRGRVTHIDPAADPRSRAARIYVRVDAEPSALPATHLFARIEISAPAEPDRIVIPRLALEDGHVWLVDSDSRLERRAVRIAYREGPRAVIAEGLAAGDRVLLTPLPFATAGMAVDVASDP
jgi:multidrug efflux pump subunit AcrA (membrane-fusion protein)